VQMSVLQDSRKLFAATVMVTFLATAVSFFGIIEAGRRAVEKQDNACAVSDLQNPMIELALRKRTDLGDPAHPEKARCILEGLERKLDADNFFLIAYSALNLSFFLFLAAIGRVRPALVWSLAGLLLAAVMLGADWWENQQLYRWIDLARKSFPPNLPVAPDLLERLAGATGVKWGVQAVASALLGLIYLTAPRPAARLVALPAFAAMGLLTAGLTEPCPTWVQSGAVVLIVLWIMILIHAVLVAIEPRLPSLPPVAAPGGQPHA
jgi:hypothetical protein